MLAKKERGPPANKSNTVIWAGNSSPSKFIIFGTFSKSVCVVFGKWHTALKMLKVPVREGLGHH